MTAAAFVLPDRFRAVVFDVEARDSVEPICRCKHARFVVDVAKTAQRLAAKAQKAGLA